MVLEKSLESPLDSKKIQPVHPKGNLSWMFMRTDAEAETPILWPSDVNWLIRKDPDAGKDWRWEEKGMTEDEMCYWMASPTQCTWVWVNSRVGDGQESLACCSLWSRKGSDMTEWLNWTELIPLHHTCVGSAVFTERRDFPTLPCPAWISSLESECWFTVWGLLNRLQSISKILGLLTPPGFLVTIL